MTTLGDQTAAWLASSDGGLAIATGALFVVILVMLACLAVAHSLWAGVGAGDDVDAEDHACPLAGMRS